MGWLVLPLRKRLRNHDMVHVGSLNSILNIWIGIRILTV
mgnify:CR=1 FL=1